MHKFHKFWLLYKVNTLPQKVRVSWMPGVIVHRLQTLVDFPYLIAKHKTEKEWLIQFVVEKHLYHKSSNVSVWCFN
jgi:hypothetical protein